MPTWNEVAGNWPRLRPKINCDVTSSSTDDYNCISWILRETGGWWHPEHPAANNWQWPDDLGDSLEDFFTFFRRHDFVDCAGDRLVDGLEKIAFYARDGATILDPPDFTHVAYQRHDGRWSSKFTYAHDFWHETPDLLEGLVYGRIRKFMERPRQPHPMCFGILSV